MTGCYACGQEVSESHVFCPFCGVNEPIPSAPSCPNCAKEVDTAWVKCPMCGEGLQSEPAYIEPQSYQSPPVSTPTFSPHPSAPVFTPSPPTQQVTLTTAPPMYPQQTYAAPPYTESSGNPMLWVGGIGAVVIVIVIIVWIIAASGSSFTWTGDLDDRVTRDGPWHTYDEDCDSMSRMTYDTDGSGKTKGACNEGDGFTMEAENENEHYTWPTSQLSIDVTYNYDSGESVSLHVVMHARNAIVSGVWFLVVEYAYVDGDYYSASDLGVSGDCFAFVSDDKMGGSSSFFNWDEAVGDVQWPSFCDSVFSY